MEKMAKLSLITMLFLFAFGSIFDTPAYASESFSPCGISGGLGGNEFHDGQTGGRIIKEVRIYSGTIIDSIQVIYTDHVNQTIAGNKHGGPGGNLSVLTLAPDEYNTTVGGKYGSFVDSLFIKTSKGQVKKWGGAGGTVDFYYSVPPGSSIHGFFGRAGKYVDSVGVIMKTIK
jgi:hypothetical protein